MPGVDLGKGKTVVELDVVHHPAGDQVRHTLTHIGLRIDHVVRSNALSNLTVFGGEGLYPNVLDTQFGEDHYGHQAGRKIRADTYDGMREIRDTQLAHDHGVGRIGLDCVRQEVCQGLHGLCVSVNTHHIMSKVHERLCHRATKTAQADDDHTIPLGKGKLLRK